ncbi:MAG TPA: hypothetical protein VKB52_13995 [Rhodanobacteraceae bacterium]|nr:hypothetical protein [Rhodanobacteraceae bacterium]
MTSLAEKVFWTMVALSSIGAGAFGYHRFKQIRPDLYDKTPHGISEDERKARIAEYQQKGDALTRAANPPARLLKPSETCANGVVVTLVREGDKAEAKAVIENGRPVTCAMQPAR